MSGIFSDMHNLFQVSKTLRFELKPIGRTEENLAQIIVQDEDRAKRFKKVKKYADEVHRQFIDDSLKKVDKDALRRAITEYCESKKNSDDKKIDDAMKKARTVISDSYKDARSTKHKTNPLSPEKIIGKLEDRFKDNADAMDNINAFNNFTTYFREYFKNRVNMYENEKKHTAIVYRLVDAPL